MLGEWQGSKGLLASWPVGIPPRSSSAEALPESVQVRWSFLSSSRLSAGALPEFYEF
jgi:hypothetical protein